MRLGVLVLLIVAATAQSARACSCAAPPSDPRAELRKADAALFGRVVGKTRHVRRDGRFVGLGTVVYRIRVLEDFKDRLPAAVRVRTASQSSACGLDLRRGARIGLILFRERGHWASNLCSVRSRRYLQLGVSGPPVADGTPPAAFVASPGGGGMALLDATGRLLARVGGSGFATTVGACPGGTTVIAGITDDAVTRLEVRDAATLDLRARRSVAEGPHALVSGVSCLSPDGSRVLITDSGARFTRVQLLDDGTLRTLWRGRALGTVVAGDRVLVNAARVRIVSADGTVTQLPGTAPGAQALDQLPGGGPVVVAARRTVAIVDPRTGVAEVTRRRSVYAVTWLNAERLVLRDARGLTVLDSTLRPVRRLAGARAGAVVPSGGGLGVFADGVLRRFDADGLPTGSPTGLFAPELVSVAAIPTPDALAGRRAARPCP